MIDDGRLANEVREMPTVARNGAVEFPQRPGYKRALVNDVGDRLKEFEGRGYTRVLRGDPVTWPVGGGVTGVLMEKPERLAELEAKAGEQAARMDDLVETMHDLEADNQRLREMAIAASECMLELAEVLDFVTSLHPSVEREPFFLIRLSRAGRNFEEAYRKYLAAGEDG